MEWRDMERYNQICY